MRPMAELLAVAGDNRVKMLMEPSAFPVSAATALVARARRTADVSRAVEKEMPPSSPEWLPPWERQGSREVQDNESEGYGFQSQKASAGQPLDVEHDDDDDSRSSSRRKPSPPPQQQHPTPNLRVFNPHKPGLTERSFEPSSCRVEGCTRLPCEFSKYCLRHSGVRKCATDRCMRTAAVTGTMCVAHRRERRCSHAGCTTAARGPAMLCVLHGGGKRCGEEGCSKSAQGATSFCKAHGGGECDPFSTAPRYIHVTHLWCYEYGRR
jgi:hypothetical protein